MKDEKLRWKDKINDAKYLENNLNIFCLISAYYVSFLLSFDEIKRDSKIIKFIENIKQNKIFKEVEDNYKKQG